MASSDTDKVESVEPWIPEAYDRDSEAITKALQMSFSQSQQSSNTHTHTHTSDSVSLSNNSSSSFLNFSGSDAKGLSGKPASSKRRKSRVSKKKSQTTFIAADPANFRQMVQQVTGVVRLGGNMQVPLVKPEPQRPATQFHAPAMLPTLDTSALLMPHYPHEDLLVSSSSDSVPGSSWWTPPWV